jgi:hypothetical protein
MLTPHTQTGMSLMTGHHRLGTSAARSQRSSASPRLAGSPAHCSTPASTPSSPRSKALAPSVSTSPHAPSTSPFARPAERRVETRFQVLDALHLDTLGETFDTVVDSGLFHVFDGIVLPGCVANPDQLRNDNRAVAFVRAFSRCR